jgi:cytochrome P450
LQITLPLWTIPVTIVLIPIAFVALRLTYFAVRYNFFNRVLKNVPRHPSLFGALDLFSTEDGVMGKLWEGINNPDGSVKPVVNLGPWLDRPYVTIQDPDAIKQILTSSDVEDYPKYDATYDFLRLILGDGLVTSKNPTVWHAHRRLLTPLFHFNILKNNAAVMIQSTRELLEVIQETGVGAYLPIKQTLSKHAMHIIIQLAFGDDFDVEWMTNFQLRALKLLNTIGMERLFFGDTVARILPFTAHRKGYHFRDQVTNAVKAAIVQRRGMSLFLLIRFFC